MKQFSKLMLIAVGFGILTVALSLVPSKPVGAMGSAPVTVTNTPLPVQGTVNVGNTPSVNVANAAVPVQGTVGAMQSGAWNVGITNTPSVNVSSLPAVQFNGAQPVAFSNAEANPVFTRDVDNAARQPLQKMLCVDGGSQTGTCSGRGIVNGFFVPDGKRLVIEEVSSLCDQRQGTVVVAVSIRTQVASDEVDHTFPLQLPATFAAPTGSEYSSSFHYVTRIYADSGMMVFISAVQAISPGIDFFCTMAVSGHLVNQ